MKNFKYISSLVLLCAGVLFCGCSKMTEVENEPYDHIGGYNTMNNAESEKYYADLRAYKQQAVNYGRPVAFGWYSNWSPAGTYRRGYLTSMPDSMDIVSMWSGAPNRFNITPEQKKDKEFVQKVKGTKLLEVTLLSYIGKGRTPDSVYTAVEKQAEKEGWANDQARVEEAKKKARWKFWGYEGVTGSDNHKQALARFAKALCDSLVANDWDGYDIDWEIGSGVFDMDGTLSTNADLVYLVKEMNKYIGLRVIQITRATVLSVLMAISVDLLRHWMDMLITGLTKLTVVQLTSITMVLTQRQLSQPITLSLLSRVVVSC